MLRLSILVAVVGFALSAPSSSKVDISLKNKSHANIAVSFSQSTDAVIRNINSMKFATRGLKVFTMKTQLQQLTASSQKNVLSFLEQDQVNFQSMWINNHLYIQGASNDLIEKIAAFPEVIEVREQFLVRLFDEPKTDNDKIPVEWNIEKIQAPEAWALQGGNNTGQGIVVASIDSGARITHEALRSNHRAEYGWFDAVDGRASPSDTLGHGSHVLGTIIGTHGIGIAPGSEWIVCRGIPDNGQGFENTIISCAEWVNCPDPECKMLPDVLSNSWGNDSGHRKKDYY